MHFVVHVERRFLQELGFGLTGAFFIIGRNEIHPHDIGSFPWERIRELHPVISIMNLINHFSSCFVYEDERIITDKSFCAVKEGG